MRNILNTNPTCFVGIFRQRKPARILIVYGVNWDYTRSKISPMAELLYLRTFDNVLDGMGHKIVLEKLTPEDLRQVIHSVNAKERDLRPLVESIMSEPVQLGQAN